MTLFFVHGNRHFSSSWNVTCCSYGFLDLNDIDHSFGHSVFSKDRA